MNSLLHWLTSPEWAQLVKALLHSLWQGALIAAALAAVLRRIANPETRYRLLLAALGALLLSSVVTWSVLNTPEVATATISQPPLQDSITPPAPTGPVEKIVVAGNRIPAPPQIQWTAWLALGWLFGAAAMLGRASVKVAGAEQLRRACQPLNDPRIAELLAEARRAVNLTRRVRLAVTSQLTSPAVVGVLVPTLILPLSLITALSPEQLRFVLLHELAHIRRGDYLANLFQLFAEALFFFNPAVWWLSHQIRREREACCDALAIELSGAPADYARTLVSVAETILNPAPAAAPAFGNDREPSSLADRVQRVLVPGYRPSLRLTWRTMLAALVASAILLGLLAAGTRQTIAAILPAAPKETRKEKVTNETNTTATASTNAPGESFLSSPEPETTSRLTVTSQGALYARTFKVDPNTFAQGMASAGGSRTTNLTERFRNLVATFGVDLQPPKAMFLNERQGILFVRASPADLDIIEQAVQALNQVAPQVNIRAKFVELPADKNGIFLGSFGLPVSNLVSVPYPKGQATAISNCFTGILTESQTKAVFKTLEARAGAEILSAPEVTTLSGRNAQIQVVDIRTIVTGVSSIGTTNNPTNTFQTSSLPFGPTLDVTPNVTADGHSIRMTLIPGVTEFLGYEKPSPEVTKYARQNSLDPDVPLPIFRLRQAVTSATIWDGQTIIIGGLVAEQKTVTKRKAPVLGDLPFLSPLFRTESAKLDKKNLLIFVTPTIIDAAGNRVNIPADAVNIPEH